MVLWPRVLVLDSILWFQEMGGSLVGGFVVALVAFCPVSLLCSFLTGTKLLSAIAGDGTLPILRFFKAVSRLPELCCILLPRGDFQ